MRLYWHIRNLVTEQKGAALAEYGLLVALIAVVCVAAVTTLGEGVRDALEQAASGL